MQAFESDSSLMTQFITIAFALCVTMAGATLASPLYPLYEQSLGITSSGITIAYAAYMAGALLALLVLGHLSDAVGFVRSVRIAILLLVIGLLISAGAHSLPMLALGRFVIGTAAGIGSSAATSGLIALEPAGPVRRAPLVGSMMTIIGLGLGPSIAGVVAQALPRPLLTPYLLFGVLALLAGAAVALLPADGRGRPIRQFRPKLRFQLPAVEMAHPFALASIATFMGYTLLSLFASLAPSFFNTLFPWHGPAVAGVGVSTLFAGSALSPNLAAKDRTAPWPHGRFACDWRECRSAGPVPWVAIWEHLHCQRHSRRPRSGADLHVGPCHRQQGLVG